MLAVTAVLLAGSSPGQPPQTIRISPAAAYGETAVKPVAPTINMDASAQAGSQWDSNDWQQWEAQVREVNAPADISVVQPLSIDVSAVDDSGLPLPNANVNVTWVLGGRQYEDQSTTGIFGTASVTRTIGTACSGKTCLVAVMVTGDNGLGCAYSTFTPK
ncbi:MAG: hypothetical protein P4L93_10955 [Coriobacteriia bacterium]|nr:hypothetical protein [Coriobacteriia bacterium]